MVILNSWIALIKKNTKLNVNEYKNFTVYYNS